MVHSLGHLTSIIVARESWSPLSGRHQSPHSLARLPVHLLTRATTFLGHELIELLILGHFVVATTKQLICHHLIRTQSTDLFEWFVRIGITTTLDGRICPINRRSIRSGDVRLDWSDRSIPSMGVEWNARGDRVGHK